MWRPLFHTTWRYSQSNERDILTESATVCDPDGSGRVLDGRDEFEAHLRELRTGFPDITIPIEDMLSQDDVVMTELTVTTTHEGGFDGIPATNRRVELQGLSNMVIQDGKL